MGIQLIKTIKGDHFQGLTDFFKGTVYAIYYVGHELSILFPVSLLLLIIITSVCSFSIKKKVQNLSVEHCVHLQPDNAQDN